MGNLRASTRKATRAGITCMMLALLFFCSATAPHAAAQTAGEGALQGTVADSSGAVIPNATITATNDATGIAKKQNATSAGYYNISPLQPGTYTVQVVAPGFKTQLQSNVVVNALQTRVFNPVLSVGEETQTVTVTAAPPVLNTADATLGLTVENETYTNLPLQMNGSQQRDPTAFGTLTPGAQSGTRMPVIGGTGNMLGQLYLDGMPATTVNQQGDNRLVSLTMSVEAVDQFQVLTSTPPAEYMGAGSMNFTMKSGGLQYHGQISNYIRNTSFDAWSFTAKAATTKNAAGATIAAPKPVEHQNEFSASFGGLVPKTGKRLFFFVAYDKYHLRKGATYALYTVPTQAMLTGDFTELNGGVGSGGVSGTSTSTNKPIIYDPTSNSCTGNACTRLPFHTTKNGVDSYNVIPSNMISPIAKAMAASMPTPSNTSSLTSNYLGGNPSGYDNHLVDWRVDYDLSSRQRISSIGTMGAVHYLNNFSSGSTTINSVAVGYGYLPLPYVAGTYANIFPKNYILEHIYTVGPNLVNQLKYSFTRFIQPQKNATDGISKYYPSAMGITNLPAGQASTEFPGAAFAPTTNFSTAQTGWTTNASGSSTQNVTPNNYALTDNVQWLKGKHSFTFGFTYQWEQINNAAPDTYSSYLSMNYSAYSTANFTANSNALSAASGYSFASYMLGAVAGYLNGPGYSGSLALQPLSEVGGRYHPFAPYVRDSYKVSPKLTVELGLRWDYLPPYHEVKDRWTFLNPNLTNPLTGTAGLLQFAGNWGGSGVSCLCRTPVQTYWKNWGPRIGIAYEINPKTILRTGFATVYSQGGGVGGRAGAAVGTGSIGFNMTATSPTESGSGSSAGPSYYLNNSTGFSTLGLANTSLFGSGYSYPSAPTPGVAAQELNTGYYVSSTTGKMVSASSVSYADPYFAGRAPEIILYNLGFERSLTPDLTLGVNFAGNESHFVINYGTTGSNARGKWTNQVDPKYLAVLGAVKDSTNTKPILNAAATAANAAIVASYFPSAPTPSFFTAAGAVSSSATIAQMLTAFPQYSAVSDTWGNVGNFNYNSLQITLNQRMHKGLTYNINYTFSKNVGDDGTYRSGFDIPASAISGGTRAYKQNRIDRSWTAISVPHSIHAYGVYKLPFGKNQIGSNSTLVRMLAGGWQFSGIYTYSSGMPMAVTWSGATSTTQPGQGTAMPDRNSAFTGPARINGKFGHGPKGYNTCNLGINPVGGSGCTAIKYVDSTAFSTPTNISTVSGSPQYLIGNAPRTAPYSLRNPYTWDVDAGLRRSIPLHRGMEFVFQADCINVWNHVTFSSPSASWASGSSTFGTITSISSSPGPRDWQFAGHLSF